MMHCKATAFGKMWSLCLIHISASGVIVVLCAANSQDG